jgi:hypothetical protein
MTGKMLAVCLTTVAMVGFTGLSYPNDVRLAQLESLGDLPGSLTGFYSPSDLSVPPLPNANVSQHLYGSLGTLACRKYITAFFASPLAVLNWFTTTTDTVRSSGLLIFLRVLRHYSMIHQMFTGSL